MEALLRTKVERTDIDALSKEISMLRDGLKGKGITVMSEVERMEGVIDGVIAKYKRPVQQQQRQSTLRPSAMQMQQLTLQSEHTSTQHSSSASSTSPSNKQQQQQQQQQQLLHQQQPLQHS